MRRVSWLAILLQLALLGCSGHKQERPTLKQATAGLFPIGVGLNDRVPGRSGDWPLLVAQFSFVTPENSLTPAWVQPAEGVFDFHLADAFVQFAERNNLKVFGQSLVFARDDASPKWLVRDGGRPASCELLLERLNDHIDTIVGRYRGRIPVWTVVNEAIDEGSGFLRPSSYSTACGERFVLEAFRYAHAADPGALLVLNDFNNEHPARRAKMLALVDTLRGASVPLWAIGLQGHYELDRIPFADIEDTLDAAREAGLKVVVTELDVDVIPRGGWWAEGGRRRAELAEQDPYSSGCPPSVLRRQAKQYAQLMSIFRRHADVVASVSFWNLHDGESWLNRFPWRRSNHPLLFDRDGRPKPAYDAVIEALLDETEVRAPLSDRAARDRDREPDW